MADPQIVNYIQQSLQSGYSSVSIRQALLQQGWNQQQVDEAFSQVQGAPQQADTQQPVAQQPPAQQTKERPIAVIIICIIGCLGAALAVLGGLIVFLLGSAVALTGLGELSFLITLVSILPIAVGAVSFVAYYFLFKMKKIGWIMVIALNAIGIALSISPLNPISIIIGAIVIAYVVLKRNLFL